MKVLRITILLGLATAGCGPINTAHDIAADAWNCKSTDILLESSQDGPESIGYNFLGCGHRGTVTCTKTQRGNWHCDPPSDLAEQSPPVPIGPPVSPRAAGDQAGCSKDTDCKGDRICVQSQCTDPPARTPPPQ